MKLAIFAESCGRAGESAGYKSDRSESIVSPYDWDTAAEQDDLVIYEGTREELAEDAARLRSIARTAGAGHDLFLLRTARTIEANLD